MQDRTLLREDDLELIDAFQLNPRASWAEVGAVLGVDPVTVARRWKRLEQEGLAWCTVALGPRQLRTMSVAFLEISCEAGAAAAVVEKLAEHSNVVTVQLVAGTYDIWAAAVAPDLRALSDYVLHQLPLLGGVTRVQTHLATRAFDLSRRWRLRVLGTARAHRLRSGSRPTTLTRPMDERDQQLFVALSRDGRQSFAELAAQTQLTPRTAQRRIHRMIANRDIDFRCDLARQLAGWRAAAVLWLVLPDDQLESVGLALLNWPHTRTCAAIAGPSNLLWTVGLHDLFELHELVRRLRREFPCANIVDRQVVLRQAKLYGRLLDSEGRQTRGVPLNFWDHPAEKAGVGNGGG